MRPTRYQYADTLDDLAAILTERGETPRTCGDLPVFGSYPIDDDRIETNSDSEALIYRCGKWQVIRLARLDAVCGPRDPEW